MLSMSVPVSTVALVDQSELLYTFAALLNPALGRATARAQLGQTLKDWGLNPHRPDPGTPMHGDDSDGYLDMIPEGVAGTVLYPIMTATDAIASAGSLVEMAKRSTPANHHTAAVLSMCRTAIESSAQAIWVMNDSDREVRRKRAAGLAKVGIEQARDWHADTIEAHENGRQLIPDENLAQSEHRLKFHEGELAVLESLEPANARKYREMVRKAANWIAENPPKHTTDVGEVHYPTFALAAYRVCSAFTHGHGWPTDLLGEPAQSFAMMADFINLALINTECAVALYEAQATDPNVRRDQFYPQRLQVTIDEWRQRFADPHLDNDASGLSPV